MCTLFLCVCNFVYITVLDMLLFQVLNLPGSVHYYIFLILMMIVFSFLAFNFPLILLNIYSSNYAFRYHHFESICKENWFVQFVLTLIYQVVLWNILQLSTVRNTMAHIDQCLVTIYFVPLRCYRNSYVNRKQDLEF